MADRTSSSHTLLPYRLARGLMPKLPVTFSYWLAERIADLVWLLARGVRANMEHNQRRALGPGATEREVALSARTALRNLTKIYVDEFRLPALPSVALREATIIHGLHHLEATHAQGKGVILASAHFGAPHVVGQLLAILGYPTSVVVEHVQPEEVFQFMTEMRQKHGVRLLPIDGPLLGLIRTLKREKGIVGLVCDRDISGTGLRIPFLGEETSFADGPAQLALRTGAPIIVGYCRRRAENGFEAFVEPPIYLPEKPENPEQALREGTMQVAARLEAFIRNEPGQWVMSVPLWEEREPES
jgi:phosphatidylinositol dimannoside acyltransferase